MNIEKNVFEMVKTILVVDDKAENRAAAREAIREIFPEKTVMEASSAQEAKEIIANRANEIDLVLSDMQMEEVLSGFYVAFEAWSRYIPAVVVTAGDHHGSYVTASRFCNPEENGGLYAAKPARKDDCEIWKDILRGIEKRNSLSLRVALAVREEAPEKMFYNKDAGEVLARLTCSGMGNIRECRV